MGYQSFEDLEVWKRSCRLAVKLYELLNDCRDFGLKNQMTRAAVSIASNVAEGAERDSKLEFIRFLHISKGSAAELRTQVYIANEINLIDETTCKELVADLKKISAMLHNLIKTLKT
jgi:four helix bundle protein